MEYTVAYPRHRNKPGLEERVLLLVQLRQEFSLDSFIRVEADRRRLPFW